MNDVDDLRELRERSGKTQTQVAAFLGTAQAAVSQWEYGKSAPDEEAVRGLARVYDVSVDLVLKAVEESEARWMESRDLRLAERLKQMRTEAGLSMTALADASGVTPGAVGFWESGITRPAASTLDAVAQALGTGPESLLRSAGYDDAEVEEYLASSVDDASPIALLLRRGRVESGLTQEQVAAALGTSQNNISAFETGVHLPRDEFIDELSRLYELDTMDVEAAMYASLTASGRVPMPTLPLPLRPSQLPRAQWARQIRAHRGDRRGDLADWLGVDTSIIGRLEDDQADGLPWQLCQRRQLVKLAAAAQCEPLDIISAYEPGMTCSQAALLAAESELIEVASSVSELLTVLHLRGRTLQELGDAAGVSREAVRQWRDGRSRPKTASFVGLAEIIEGTSEQQLHEFIERERNPPADGPDDVEPAQPGSPDYIFGNLN